LTPEQQERIDKRIAKEVRRRKEAEEALEQLRQEREAKADTPPETPPPPGPNPEDNHPEVRQLRDKLKTWNSARGILQAELKRMDEEVLEQGTFTLKDGTTRQLSRAEIESQLETIAGQVDDLKFDERAAVREARKTFEADRRQLEAQAEKDFPWLKDRKAAEWEGAGWLIQQVPELKRLAGWKMGLAWMEEGRKAWLARQQATRTPTPAKPVHTAPKAGAAPRPSPNGKGHLARQRFLRSGTTDDLAQALTGII